MIITQNQERIYHRSIKERQRDRQTDRQTNPNTSTSMRRERETDRQTNPSTNTSMGRGTEREISYPIIYPIEGPINNSYKLSKICTILH